jgi:glycosyltransferase involved in cell wall biosynthesis
MSPTVSVILPTFNRSRTLPAAMRSVLDQSFRDLELIVVDDASTEDIAALVAGVGDPRIRYLRHDRNQGAAAARDTGLAAAGGRFVAFQDSDDLWLPGKLDRQIGLLERQPPRVGVVTGMKVLYGRDAAGTYGPGLVFCAPDPARRITLDEDQLKHTLLDCRISLQNALFRRDCMPDLVWFDPLAQANEDWEFTIRLVQNTLIFEDPEPVVFARISSDSISTKPRINATGYTRILKKNRDIFRKYPREYGIFTYNYGLALMRAGRRRAALRWLAKSLVLRPANIARALRSIGRRIIRADRRGHRT